jgi:hypothetical protein
VKAERHRICNSSFRPLFLSDPAFCAETARPVETILKKLGNKMIIPHAFPLEKTFFKKNTPEKNRAYFLIGFTG